MWSPACIFFFYFSNQKILTPIQSGAAEPAYSTSPSLKAWEGHKAFRHWVCMTNNSNSTFVILVTIISRRYFADLHPATSSRARRTAWMTSRKPSKSFTRTEGGICRSMTANSTRAGTTSCVLYLHLKHVYLLLPCTKKKKKSVFMSRYCILLPLQPPKRLLLLRYFVLLFCYTCSRADSASTAIALTRPDRRRRGRHLNSFAAD
jgi:hypothetical protein